MPQSPPSESRPARRLVVVSGAGRSGTSTVAGALSKLGYQVPQPEVEPNRSNPRGFFESRWVVDFHAKMLSAGDSTALDTRPSVLDTLHRVAARQVFRNQLRDWLEEHIEDGDLVIKDPRTFWFLDLWEDTAAELDTEIKYLTMVRHPAEVVGSRDAYYLSKKTPEERAAGEVANLAGWVNCSLVNELVTRRRVRTFVRYTDLLENWRRALGQVASELSIPYTSDISQRRHPVDKFIDGDLRRVRATWEDRAVPDWLKDVADETWMLLSGERGSPQEDTVRVQLDGIRDRYAREFSDSIALARDHTRAAVRVSRRQTRRKVRDELTRGQPESHPPTNSSPQATKEGPRTTISKQSERSQASRSTTRLSGRIPLPWRFNRWQR